MRIYSALAAVLLLLLPLPAQAGTILLAEVYAPKPMLLPTSRYQYVIAVGETTAWNVPTTNLDLGPFTADQQTVDEFELALHTDATNRMQVWSDPIGVSVARSIFWTTQGFFPTPDGRLWVDGVLFTFVPERGPWLTGYDLTGVTIEVLPDTPLPGVPNSPPHSVVARFYGEPIPVPEPASWLLACLALCLFRRHRSNGSKIM